ncbi:MAG: Hsp20/alpha crystallin family protein [bacterium]|nr:Hsp20/alpha crystallin family protein [Candidatus Sumerlaeota bacterium]
MANKCNKDEESPKRLGAGLGSILGGLENLIRKLEDLSQTADEVTKTGEFKSGDKVRGVYGFSVRMGTGGEGIKVEPFGTVRQEKMAGESKVVEIREPMVDVFDEKDHVLVVAEMPGIAVSDLKIDLNDDILIITAEKGDKKYHKEVLLPTAFPKEGMSVVCNNGIIELKFLK